MSKLALSNDSELELGLHELDVDNSTEEPLLREKPVNGVSWRIPVWVKQSRSSSTEWSSPRKIAGRVFLVLFVILGVANIIQKSVRYFQGPEMGYLQCHCGYSTAEARQNGCKFDLLGPAWLPDKCRDDELTKEFMTAGTGPNGTWEFWFDHNHTMPMTLEELSLLPDTNGVFYGTWEFHVEHCMFQWKKHIRSLTVGGTNMDAENTGVGHVEHCEMVIKHGLPVRATIPLNVHDDAWKKVHPEDRD